MTAGNPFLDERWTGPVPQAPPSRSPVPSPRRDVEPREVPESAVNAVADQARRQVASIIAAFEDALDPSQPISVRLKAADQMLAIEAESTKLATAAHDRDLDSMSKVDMVREVMDLIGQLQRAGLVRVNPADSDVIEGTVVDG